MGELKNRYQLFSEAVLRGEKASVAYAQAGYVLENKPTGYYVYALIDPEIGAVFYIGKGKGNRRYCHAKQAHQFGHNPRKNQRILDIQHKGKAVLVLVLDHGLSETKALEIEKALIKKVGAALTNRSSGVITEREQAKLLLSQVKPFHIWKAQNQTSEDDIDTYWAVVSSLKKIASQPDDAVPSNVWINPSEITFRDGYAVYR